MFLHQNYNNLKGQITPKPPTIYLDIMARLLKLIHRP